MNKIGIRVIILVLLVGAVIYIANFKYKAVQKHFFVEGAELINESEYVILNEAGDTVFTESLEIQKGTYQTYYESKKYKSGSDKIFEAFRLVSDSSGNYLWGSYEKFELVTDDSITRTYALYSTFQPELMRTLPVIGFRDKSKQDIELSKDYLVFNNLYSVLSSYKLKQKAEYEFIVLDSVNHSYELSSVSASFTEPDSTKKFRWDLTSAANDTLFSIFGNTSSNSVNLIIDYKNKLTVKRVYGRDYQYKELNQDIVKNQGSKKN